MTDHAAICFDLDGVLIDTMPHHASAWQEALARQGVRVSRRLIYEWEGEPGLRTARRLLQRAGRRSPRAAAALLAEKEGRFTRQARRIRVHPELGRLLGALRRRRIPLALVTGTSAAELRRILPRKILAGFRVVVTGDLVRRGKPHPEPYRTAFRQLGVAAHTAVVVENSPYGIRSARQAGAGLIIALASSLPSRFLRKADVIVGSAERLRALVEHLASSFTG